MIFPVDTFVPAKRLTKKGAGNVRIRDLRCYRRGLFAKVVILAYQKSRLATAHVRAVTGGYLSVVWRLAPRNLLKENKIFFENIRHQDVSACIFHLY